LTPSPSHGEEGKTASWAGNSPDMIHAHYRALMSAKDAAAFFQILPAGFKAATKRGKIVELKAAEAKPAAAAGARGGGRL
jgi:hypothetical protein